MVLVLGAALVVFFAGVSAVLAANGSAPTEMWAAGAAISGALVGLLVPPPGPEGAAQLGASSTIAELAAGAVQAAQQAAEQKEGADKGAARQAVQRVQDLTGRVQTATFIRAASVKPAQAPNIAASNTIEGLRELVMSGAPGSAEADVYSAAAAAANQQQVNAVNTGAVAAAAVGANKLTGIVWVLLAIFVALLAVGIGMSFIPSEGDQLINQADKTVLALASSAGGAVIGLLAPSTSGASGK